MARRNKPHDPAAATRAADERKEREAERRRLLAQGAVIRIDAAGRIISARRSNVFKILLDRKAISVDHHDAAYTLAMEWAAWKGMDGGPEPRLESVGGSGALDEAECGLIAAKRRVTAGLRVERALGQIDAISRLLLEAFMVATVEEDRPMSWRGIVERTLHETRKEEQTSLVVYALESLRAVYQEPGRVAA